MLNNPSNNTGKDQTLTDIQKNFPEVFRYC